MERLEPCCVPDERFEELRAGLEIVALRRLGDLEDARDAAQECLARLLERLRRGPDLPDAELGPVAYGILRHVIGDLLRVRARIVSIGSDTPQEAYDALELLVAAEERAALATAIDSLAAEDRELLRRCYVDGDRIGSIALALGEPAARVRKRKSRAMARLRDALRRASPAGYDLASDAMRAS